VAGQRVSVSGILNSDFLILPGRLNAGERGYWVIGHLIESGTDASLAVAVGWAPTLNDAQAAVAEITATEPSAVSAAVTGRYLPSESPQEDDFENGIQNAMSVAAIINQWQTEPDGVYGGYLILDESSVAALTESTTAQLAVIDSVAPSVEVRLNWLNIFYAIEWVVFAVFAVFLWFRLVRDAYQREQEDAAELN
jgi:cytochrome oxidase assembly protein ShyY1